jgi:hypothetical protein
VLGFQAKTYRVEEGVLASRARRLFLLLQETANADNSYFVLYSYSAFFQ